MEGTRGSHVVRLGLYVKKVKEDVAVITLSGDLDIYSSPRLQEQISTFAENGRPFIVLNLFGLVYMDSAGLMGIVTSVLRVRDVGGDVRLVSRRHLVAKWLRLACLDQIFRIFESVEEALDSWNCVERNGHFVGLGVEGG